MHKKNTRFEKHQQKKGKSHLINILPFCYFFSNGANQKKKTVFFKYIQDTIESAECPNQSSLKGGEALPPGTASRNKFPAGN